MHQSVLYLGHRIYKRYTLSAPHLGLEDCYVLLLFTPNVSSGIGFYFMNGFKNMSFHL